MDPIDAICSIAAPELNFLLTVPPFIFDGDLDDGGLDYGWYCREHAFCAYMLGTFLKIDPHIIGGDVVVDAPGEQRLATHGTSPGHFWCSTRLTPILDLSLALRYHRMDPQLAGPVRGAGINGEFDIGVVPLDFDPDAIIDNPDRRPMVGYLPRRSFCCSTRDLICMPTILFDHDQAHDISLCISIHLINLVQGAADSFLSGETHSEEMALSELVQKYGQHSQRLLMETLQLP